MDLHSLRYFRTIAREGSITAASRLLGVSQPTLSVAVRNLEEELGTRLLTRTRAGVELTATGQVLALRADAILSQVDEAIQHVRDLHEDEVGAFTVGCQESLGAYFLPGFLDRFLSACPGIVVDLWNGPSGQVRQAVLDRQVHYGLVVNCESHDDLVMTRLFDDQVGLFTTTSRGPEARITASRSVGLDLARSVLASAPLIWCDRPVFRTLLGRIEAAGVAIPRQLVCGDLELVKSLCLEGIGVGLLPARVAAYGQPGRLRFLSPALPRHDDVIQLVYRGDLHRTRAAKVLREALLEQGRTLDRIGRAELGSG